MCVFLGLPCGACVYSVSVGFLVSIVVLVTGLRVCGSVSPEGLRYDLMSPSCFLAQQLTHTYTPAAAHRLGPHHHLSLTHRSHCKTALKYLKKNHH